MELDYAKGVAEYFRTNQWKYFTELLQTLRINSHIHIFVNTSIHPLSLERIVKEYLAMRDWAVNRVNEMLRWSAPKTGVIHGVHPHDMPHFDMIWRFKGDVVLEPMEEKLAEQGRNVLYWDEAYMQTFYQGYHWRSVGRAEEEEILAYFETSHWNNAFDLIVNPDTPHIHVNVETCIHPSVLERFFLKAIENRGWKILRTVPNVVVSHGVYYGKIMFLVSEPELSFDFSWFYNPEVILAPCTQQRLVYGNSEYLIVKKKDIDDLIAEDDYVTLDENEIQRCLRSIEI